MTEPVSDYWAHEDHETHTCDRCKIGLVPPSSNKKYRVYVIDGATDQAIINWVHICDGCEVDVGMQIECMLTSAASKP